jgi:eukaryotic-like serine/threonine-protein kinase
MPDDAPISSPSPQNPPAATSRRVGDYELIEEISRGGLGVVFRARQISLGREVAIKLLRDGAVARPEDRERFRTEALAAAALDHPNIVPVHEVGDDAGRAFIAMRLVPGRDLAAATRDGPLPPGKAAELLARIAQAIQHAHDRGVLHRDLKPANVLLDLAGEPHVTDFGLARRLDDERDLTLSGEVVGTPGYLSPEQAAGRSRDVSRASDIWALGALLYHLLTGRAPFVADTPSAVLRLVESADPVGPRLLNPSVPRALETITLKALAKNPGDRYATAGELAADVGRFLRQEPILARPASAAERTWRWVRRHPARAAVVALSVSLVAAVLAITIATNRRLARQRAEAEQVKDFLAEVLTLPEPGKDGRQLRIFDLLAHASRRLDSELTNQPLVRAELAQAIAATYYQLIRYDEATRLGQLAIQLYEQTVGPNHPWTLQAVSDLGEVLDWASNSSAGLPHHERAVKGLRPHRKDRPLLLAEALASYGSSLVQCGRYPDAEPVLREAIAITEELGPQADAIRCPAMGDLAQVLERDPQRLGEALQTSLQVIELLRRMPDGKVNLGTSLGNISDTYLSQWRLPEAEATAAESLQLREELWGTNSSQAAFARIRVAVCQIARTNFAEGLANAEAALQIQIASLRPGHRELQFGHRMVGRALFAMGRYADSEAAFRRAHEVIQNTYPPDSAVALSLEYRLGEAIAVQHGARPEAIERLKAGMEFERNAVVTYPGDVQRRDRFLAMSNLVAQTDGVAATNRIALP